MAFAQKLARNVNAYGAETQQLMQEAVATKKNYFMQHCECASKEGKYSFTGNFEVEGKVVNRQDYSREKCGTYSKRAWQIWGSNALMSSICTAVQILK